MPTHTGGVAGLGGSGGGSASSGSNGLRVEDNNKIAVPHSRNFVCTTETRFVLILRFECAILVVNSD